MMIPIVPTMPAIIMVVIAIMVPVMVIAIMVVIRAIRIWPIIRPAMEAKLQHRRRHDYRGSRSVNRRRFRINLRRLHISRRSHEDGGRRQGNSNAKAHARL